eukprot:jgi/Psemu1/22286/gm1.22286_g
MMNITEGRTAFHEALPNLWVHFQGKSKRTFTTINLRHLDIKLLTHQDFYQYFLPKLFQNSFILGTTVLWEEKWVPVGFHRQGDMNIPKTGKVLLPLHSPLIFHYVLNYKDTVSNYYNIYFTMQTWHRKDRSGTFHRFKGIIYLVKQWLITKFVDHGTNLGLTHLHHTKLHHHTNTTTVPYHKPLPVCPSYCFSIHGLSSINSLLSPSTAILPFL